MDANCLDVVTEGGLSYNNEFVDLQTDVNKSLWMGFFELVVALAGMGSDYLFLHHFTQETADVEETAGCSTQRMFEFQTAFFAFLDAVLSCVDFMVFTRP